MLRSGSLDRRVKILRRAPASDDGYGAQPGEWLAAFRRWASVKPRGSQAREGGEPIVAEGKAGRRVLSVWLRWDSETREITEQHALELDDVRYEIVAPPLELGRREGIELLVVASSLDGISAA